LAELLSLHRWLSFVIKNAPAFCPAGSIVISQDEKAMAGERAKDFRVERKIQLSE
jgi:hypothetical protein